MAELQAEAAEAAAAAEARIADAAGAAAAQQQQLRQRVAELETEAAAMREQMQQMQVGLRGWGVSLPLHSAVACGAGIGIAVCVLPPAGAVASCPPHSVSSEPHTSHATHANTLLSHTAVALSVLVMSCTTDSTAVTLSRSVLPVFLHYSVNSCGSVCPLCVLVAG